MGQSRAQDDRPQLTVVTRLAAAEQEKLRALLGRLSETHAFRLRMVPRSERGAAVLPRRGRWDLAIGFPGSVLEAGAAAGLVAPLDERTAYALMRTVVYGARSGLAAASWDEVLAVPSGRLVIPDFRAEPEFKEALASLLPRVDAAAIRAILTDPRASLSSSDIRRELRRDPNAMGILALLRSESERLEPMPVARIGAAVAARSRHPQLARRVLDEILDRENKTEWLVSDLGFLPEDAVNVQALAAPTAAQIAQVESIAERAEPVVPSGERTLQDWIDTVLLSGAGLALVAIVFAGSRRRATGTR